VQGGVMPVFCLKRKQLSASISDGEATEQNFEGVTLDFKKKERKRTPGYPTASESAFDCFRRGSPVRSAHRETSDRKSTGAQDVCGSARARDSLKQQRHLR
jgi:hypothetical protein